MPYKGLLLLGFASLFTTGASLVAPVVAGVVDPVGVSSSEHIIASLINAGGMGILSLVLFYLHTTGIKNAREDLRAEQKQSFEDRGRFLSVMELHARVSESTVKAMDALVERLEKS